MARPGRHSISTACWRLRSTGPRLVSSSFSQVLQLECAALAAHLVGGHLLEAVHQVRGAGEVEEQQPRALAHPLREFDQLGAHDLLAARAVCAKARASSPIWVAVVSATPSGRVDLVSDAGDELAERGELLGLDERRPAFGAAPRAQCRRG